MTKTNDLQVATILARGIARLRAVAITKDPDGERGDQTVADEQSQTTDLDDKETT